MFGLLCWFPQKRRQTFKPQSSTDDVLTLALGPNRPTQLDDLAEELLNEIVAYLIPEPHNTTLVLDDLLSTSLVSRRLHRITEPHLYRSAHITLNKSERSLKIYIAQLNTILGRCTLDISTTNGCNAEAFVRTMRLRPDLAMHVKYLRLSRQDVGLGCRSYLGLDGYEQNSPVKLSFADLEHAAETRTPLQYATLMQSLPLRLIETVDQASMTAHEILRRLPNVSHLDRSGYQTDAPCDPLIETLAGLGTLPTCHDFRNLKVLKIACKNKPLDCFWMLFTLPKLDTLTLSGAFSTDMQEQVIPCWESVQACSIKQLSLPKLELYGGRYESAVVLAHIARICTELETLCIITSCKLRNLTWTCNYLAPFQQRFSKLQHMEIFDKQPRVSLFGVHATVQPNAGAIHMLRRSNSLTCLIVDAVDLLKLIDEDELRAHNAIIPGMLQRHYSNGTPGGPRFYALMDLTLPQSLISLTLRIGDEDFMHNAFIEVLEMLARDVRKWLPALKHLTLWWHKSESYMYTHEHALAVQLRKQGVQLRSEYAS